MLALPHRLLLPQRLLLLLAALPRRQELHIVKMPVDMLLCARGHIRRWEMGMFVCPWEERTDE